MHRKKAQCEDLWFTIDIIMTIKSEFVMFKIFKHLVKPRDEQSGQQL